MRHFTRYTLLPVPDAAFGAQYGAVGSDGTIIIGPRLDKRQQVTTHRAKLRRQLVG